MDFTANVKDALAHLKNGNVIVHGRNKNIETYYQIWKGTPQWLDYYIWVNKTKQPAKLKTLNMPRYICRTWANNYANEDTTITIPGDKSNDRLQEVFQNTNLFGRINNFTEMFMGIGIGATVVETEITVDEETGNILAPSDDTEIKIKMVPGRRIIPITIDDGEVTECAFVSYTTGGARLTIHYLENNKYNIATFKGKDVANNGNISFDYEHPTIIPTDAPKDTPLFQIWMPNLCEEDEVDKSIGTSIFATALDSFKHIDLGYTAYYKEIKLGQKVKFLSTDSIDFDEDGNPIYPYDEEDESIMFVKDANDKGSVMQEFNGELRIDAITKYINTNLNCAAMLCGLGQTQFEFDGGSGRPIQTATGVIAKQTELYRNVIKQENLATDRFKKLVKAIAYINNEFTNKPKIEIKSINDIQVLYDDNIVEDTASKKAADLQEVQAGVMSIAEFRAAWYDQSEEDAIKFVQENGLLLDKYILALQSYVITPEIFVDLVFGENCKNKKALIDYIQEHYGTKPEEQKEESGFEDETEEEPKEEKQEETEDDVDEE